MIRYWQCVKSIKNTLKSTTIHHYVDKKRTPKKCSYFLSKNYNYLLLILFFYFFTKTILEINYCVNFSIILYFKIFNI